MGKIEVYHFPPGDQWRTREEIQREEDTSEKWWEGLDDPQRESLIFIVREALDAMKSNVETWLPTSMKPVDGDRADVYISIFMAEVQEEVVRKKSEAEKRLAEAVRGVQDIERDLASKG